MIVALIACAAWLTGGAVIARRLFARWRPSRVPLCQGHHTNRYGHERTSHGTGCYRRRKADLTTVKIDTDPAAMGWAVAAALMWPFVIIGLALMASPPELPEEKECRLKDLERRLAELEEEMK